jgi:hypothetical protein
LAVLYVGGKRSYYASRNKGNEKVFKFHISKI